MPESLILLALSRGIRISGPLSPITADVGLVATPPNASLASLSGGIEPDPPAETLPGSDENSSGPPAICAPTTRGTAIAPTAAAPLAIAPRRPPPPRAP